MSKLDILSKHAIIIEKIKFIEYTQALSFYVY